MHDVLDPRDYIPDEAEQLALSGYTVGSLEAQARSAAAADDLHGLASIHAELQQLTRDADWGYDEPDDEDALHLLCDSIARVDVDEAALPERIRGAWLGRAVGNTLGKPVEGLSRTEMESYLRAADQWPLTGYLPLIEPLPAGVTK